MNCILGIVTSRLGQSVITAQMYYQFTKYAFTSKTGLPSFFPVSVLQILEGFSAFLSLLSDICLLMKNEYFKLEFISKRWFYCVACMTWPRISQHTIFNRLAINFHRKRTWYNDIRWPKGDLDRQQTSYIT